MHARPRLFGTQMIEFGITLVAQNQPTGTVEHAQTLRHVIQRVAQQSHAHAAAEIGKQPGRGSGAEAKRRRQQNALDCDRCIAQQFGKRHWTIGQDGAEA